MQMLIKNAKLRDREELEGCHPQYIVAHPSEVAEIVKKKNESHGRME